jgi:hypothetical protein
MVKRSVICLSGAGNAHLEKAFYRHAEGEIFPHRIKSGDHSPESALTDAEFDALCLQNPRVKALVEVAKLAPPAFRSLMGELAGIRATDWGLVNDCLCGIDVALAPFQEKEQR